MKDIPGTTIILGIFIPLLFGVFALGFFGPSDMPLPKNTWDEVQLIKNQIASRAIRLEPGKKKVLNFPIFLVQIERLPQEALDSAQYIVRFRSQGSVPKSKTWIEDGFDVALIDAEPDLSVGNVRLVQMMKTVRRNEDG